MAAKREPEEKPVFVESAARHFIVKPPKHASRYRRWRVWHDFGHFEHGIVYRATKWRAMSPTGQLIEHPAVTDTGSLKWLEAEIDRIEDAKAALVAPIQEK